MPTKKRTPTIRDEIQNIPIVPQDIYIDKLIRDLVETIKAVAPGRNFNSVVKAEKYLAEKVK